MAFALFMASPAGRILRIVAGIILLLAGLFVITGMVGWIVAVVGLLPMAAGLFDFCLFAPLFGAAFFGRDVRNGTTPSR